MAFTPILQNQPISYVISRTSYRNSARETLAGGTPVFFVPKNATLNEYGYGGPKYKYGYTYYNCPSPDSNYNGNCTWWCWGRLNETMGTSLANYGDAKNWYANYTGNKDLDANNIQAGDIIVFSDSGAGHVMFVEQVSGSTIYISHSAYSTRSVWQGRACLVGNYQKTDIIAGHSINMYKDSDSAYYVTVVGVIHTGGSGPTPPTPTDTPTVSVSPSSVSSTMSASANYIDFNFTVTVSGIPENEDARGGFSFSSNCYRYAYTSNWVYTSYTSGGNTYLTGTRSLTVRYDRLHDYAYTDTAYMYYNKTFSNGSVSKSTKMNITILEKESDEITTVLLNFLKDKKRKVRYIFRI